ncbi:hypothetical protein N007_05380 [Alicyclobacillus acidoterrestris ATCC 49025]|nr:hypothetical protein N007_05380 [Alicyclobacillus acidoterrestris ATCC 49025]
MRLIVNVLYDNGIEREYENLVDKAFRENIHASITIHDSHHCRVINVSKVSDIHFYKTI